MTVLWHIVSPRECTPDAYLCDAFLSVPVCWWTITFELTWSIALQAIVLRLVLTPVSWCRDLCNGDVSGDGQLSVKIISVWKWSDAWSVTIQIWSVTGQVWSVTIQISSVNQKKGAPGPGSGWSVFNIRHGAAADLGDLPACNVGNLAYKVMPAHTCKYVTCTSIQRHCRSSLPAWAQSRCGFVDPSHRCYRTIMCHSLSFVGRFGPRSNKGWRVRVVTSERAHAVKRKRSSSVLTGNLNFNFTTLHSSWLTDPSPPSFLVGQNTSHRPARLLNLSERKNLSLHLSLQHCLSVGEW